MDDEFAPKARDKALRINLDKTIYGSFAEIGAGQEVAAHFFKAGGASGTVAKTMSAYDMKFSDAIYGSEEHKRYVSQSRLEKMLKKEFNLCEVRLEEIAHQTRFFAFADTLTTINFERTRQGHGWIGIRFQIQPQSPFNECIMHVQMHDRDALTQQQALGIVGVNLIYACYYHYHDSDKFLDSLMDGLLPGRIEIDFLQIKGPDFEGVDNRIISMRLVKKGLTNATMFGPKGDVILAADKLYKKNVAVLRGRYRPPTLQTLDMLKTGWRRFRAEDDVDPEQSMLITELTLNNLLNTQDTEVDEKDFLDRVDILCSTGQTVMISNFQEYYKLVNYLSRITRKRKLGIILGIHNLENIFDEKYYEFLPGGILEAFGRLFGNNVKMYVYPSSGGEVDDIYNCQSINIREHLRPLLQYLLINGKIEDIEEADSKLFTIYSDDVLEMIQKNQEGWEDYMHHRVAKIIKDHCLFGFQCDTLEPKNTSSSRFLNTST
jgi:hypothetical protein